MATAVRGVAAVAALALTSGAVVVAGPSQAAAPDAATLLASSVTALSAQRGFQVSLSSGIGSQRSTAVITVTGRGSRGIISQPGTGTVQVVGTARRIFLKGDAAFRASLSARASRRLGGRWLALSTGSAAGLGYGGKADGSLPAAHAFQTLSSVRALVGVITNTSAVPRLIGSRVIDGVPATGIVSGEVEVWVRATGVPLPLQFRIAAGTPATGMFGRWGEAPALQIPRPSIKAESLPGMGRTRPTRSGARVAKGGNFRNTLISPGVGMLGIRLGGSPASVRRAVGKPYDITAGTNVFGPFSMWHFTNQLHVDMNGRRVVGLTLGTGGAHTSEGIGVGSTLSRLRSTYDVQCATKRGALWTDCTLGDALVGAVVTTFRARDGVVKEISIVRIVD